MNKTKQILNQLRDYESRNVTFVEADGSWPIVWDRARGVLVWDADGKKYLDLTAAFGVAAAGHANPRVVAAGQKQMEKLLHAMGDVHPHALKAELAQELSRLTFERWTKSKRKNGKPEALTGKTIFCNSGFEAVEAALKTAMLATNKPGLIAFEGGYHGLGYGALNATHREHFRAPFSTQLKGFAEFVGFPTTPAQLKRAAAEIRDLLHFKDIGAILVEPVQARGGINVPPPKFLPMLRRLCDEYDALLILDEVYTGLGRTGKWFACEHSGTVPDIICLGKALTGGFPLSACVGRAELMDTAWPVSGGEAIHTSTFLGHPVGCAMALAQIAEIRKEKLVERSEQLGRYLLRTLQTTISNPQFNISIRGLGLMAGVALCLHGRVPATIASLHIIKEMLHLGFVLLPEGADANVISFTPPLTITKPQLAATVKALQKVLNHR
ncbi:MAG: 4-aminobutyrate aminotransferase/4-aminobutyrate aminotransferase/(S)-3-amino-2-methylpropionate [Pedosphaera sp.]|nr:4-aminobutyrate aminotransferase/4-aminobutyrate aminotransferase/(S)-3-amino-2-methylpropionate [Pedosphaera sp.]